ncbi:MAG: bifunctional riboflavin kinase/FAD synthetase [Rhodospirillales bacterium]|nr:bifunctional riboflavin kinase/FAD synthetase [Rhodospirillales bacterium]
MDIFTSLDDLPDRAHGAVIAIGNFDGLHRGHQALLQTVKGKADELGKPFGVLTFEPHPRALFRPDDPPFRITPPSLKAERLAACGVDMLYSLPFDWDFASQSAQKFIENVLINGLRPVHIVIGEDFCFGQLRKGNADTLRAAGLSVTTIGKVVCDHDQILSSSRIRAALRRGDIEEANALLGWEWEMRGTVVHGDKRGRELGYPTANVPLKDTLHPAYGVYATWVQVEGETVWHKAATNIGIRPMFKIPTGQIEAHILDFDGDLYGKILRVFPVKRLRGEAKFDSLDALIAQIDADCDEARTLLKDRPG